MNQVSQHTDMCARAHARTHTLRERKRELYFYGTENEEGIRMTKES